jgi:putative membrane protein
MRLVAVWASTAIGLLVISQLGIGIAARSLGAVVVAAALLGLINLIVRPVVRLITLPINLITLGLFGWVINGLMLWATSWLVPGFTVNGFLPAVLGAVLLAMISGVFHWIIGR